MFPVSRLFRVLMLLQHVPVSDGCRGQEGGIMCCLFLELKHKMILTSLYPSRTDPVVTCPVASTSSSQCYCHSVV